MKSKQETIDLINNSISSIFTKEDVISIVSGIEVSSKASITPEQLDDIANEVSNKINRNRDDIVTIESVTVTAGSYSSNIDDLDISLNENEITDIVRDILVDNFTPAEDNSTGENNSPQNQ